jgi:hypothetical protein
MKFCICGQITEDSFVLRFEENQFRLWSIHLLKNLATASDSIRT